LDFGGGFQYLAWIFLRGNRFRLKTQCEFDVWALCFGSSEFQYLARPMQN